MGIEKILMVELWIVLLLGIVIVPLAVINRVFMSGKHDYVSDEVRFQWKTRELGRNLIMSIPYGVIFIGMTLLMFKVDVAGMVTENKWIAVLINIVIVRYILGLVIYLDSKTEKILGYRGLWDDNTTVIRDIGYGLTIYPHRGVIMEPRPTITYRIIMQPIGSVIVLFLYPVLVIIKLISSIRRTVKILNGTI